MEFTDLIEFIKINNDDLINNIKISSTNLENIIEGFQICVKQYNSKFNELIQEIKGIHNNLSDNKQKLEKSKNSYFILCKSIHDQEKSIYKLSDEVIDLENQYDKTVQQFKNELHDIKDNDKNKKESSKDKKTRDEKEKEKQEKEREKTLTKMLKEKAFKDNELQNANKNVIKSKQSIEEIEENYKNDLNKINQNLIESESKYKRFINKIQDLEESKIINLSTFLLNFKNEEINFAKKMESNENSILVEAKKLNSQVLLRNIQKLNKSFLYQSADRREFKRFQIEYFLNYDIYKRNYSRIKKYKNFLNQDIAKVNKESDSKDIKDKDIDLTRKKDGKENKKMQKLNVIEEGSKMKSDNYVDNNNKNTNDNELDQNKVKQLSNYSGFTSISDFNVSLNNENFSCKSYDYIDYKQEALEEKLRIKALDQLFYSDIPIDVEILTTLMESINEEDELKTKIINNENQINMNNIKKLNNNQKNIEEQTFSDIDLLNNTINNILKSKFKICDVLILQLLAYPYYNVECYNNFHYIANLLNIIISNESSAIRVFEILKIADSIYYDLEKQEKKQNVSMKSMMYLTNQKSTNECNKDSEKNKEIRFNIEEMNSLMESRRSYLSVLLKNCNRFRVKDFYLSLINNVIDSRLNLEIKSYFETKNNSDNKTFFKNTIKENKNFEDKIKLGVMIEEKHKQIITNVLIEFSLFVLSYEPNFKEIKNLVESICIKEVLDDNNIKLISSKLYCSKFSIKAGTNKFFNDEKIKKNYDSYYYSISNKIKKNIKNQYSLNKSKDFKNSKDNKDNKTINSGKDQNKLFYSLLSSSKFLSNVDFANLCQVNYFLWNNLSMFRLKYYLKHSETFKSKSKTKNDHKSETKRKSIIDIKRIKIWKYLILKNIEDENLIVKKRYKMIKTKFGKNDKNDKNLDILTVYKVIDVNDNKENTQDNENNCDVKRNENNDRNTENIDKIQINSNYFNRKFFTECHLSQLKYEDLIEIVNNEENLFSIYDVINLDVLRTFYNHNHVNDLRKKLNNILKATAFTTKVSYCQGMNYLAALILYMTNYNEEEAFKIFYLIIQGTEYKSLFEDELTVLKKHFYSFKRLVEMILPEIFTTFNKHSISVAFFSSSWFITIFSSLIAKEEEIPEIIKYILDEFITKGWVVILKVSICLLKVNEEKLLSMKYEEMLQFLINKITECWFFDNEYINEAICAMTSVNITSDIIHRLEDEYILTKSHEDEF